MHFPHRSSLQTEKYKWKWKQKYKANFFLHSIVVIVQNWLRGVLRGAAYSLLLNLKLIAFYQHEVQKWEKNSALYEVSTNCSLNAKRIKTQWIAALHFQVLVFLPKIDIEIQISRDSDLNIERFRFEFQMTLLKIWLHCIDRFQNAAGLGCCCISEVLLFLPEQNLNWGGWQ